MFNTSSLYNLCYCFYSPITILFDTFKFMLHYLFIKHYNLLVEPSYYRIVEKYLCS